MQASKRPDTDQWKKLFDLATKFRKAKPWNMFSDSDFFAIRRPSNGEIVFPLIMGNGGHFFGLSIYLGETGLVQYSMAQANLDAFHPVFMSMYSNILLSFMDRKFLSKDDLKLPGSMGLTFRGEKRLASIPENEMHAPGQPDKQRGSGYLDRDHAPDH